MLFSGCSLKAKGVLGHSNDTNLTCPECILDYTITRQVLKQELGNE